MRLRALVYRAHNPQWSWTPISGEGARRHGGRFNRRGVPALYTSFAPLVAIREAQPLGRPMQPLTLCAYEVDAEPVFDAMDQERRRALGVTESELACAMWEAEMLAGAIPASQALADRTDCSGLCWHESPKPCRRGLRRRPQSRAVELERRPTRPRSPDRRRGPAVRDFRSTSRELD